MWKKLHLPRHWVVVALIFCVIGRNSCLVRVTKGFRGPGLQGSRTKSSGFFGSKAAKAVKASRPVNTYVTVLRRVLLKRIDSAINVKLRQDFVKVHKSGFCSPERCTEWNAPFFVKFIDFEQEEWKSLRQYEIPPKIVTSWRYSMNTLNAVFPGVGAGG